MPSRENISETSRQIGRGLLVPTLRIVFSPFLKYCANKRERPSGPGKAARANQAESARGRSLATFCLVMYGRAPAVQGESDYQRSVRMFLRQAVRRLRAMIRDCLGATKISSDLSAGGWVDSVSAKLTNDLAGVVSAAF
jgi:hypothetical protein